MGKHNDKKKYYNNNNKGNKRGEELTGIYLLTNRDYDRCPYHN
jgi:hypothetical protein